MEELDAIDHLNNLFIKIKEELLDKVALTQDILGSEQNKIALRHKDVWLKQLGSNGSAAYILLCSRLGYFGLIASEEFDSGKEYLSARYPAFYARAKKRGLSRVSRMHTARRIATCNNYEAAKSLDFHYGQGIKKPVLLSYENGNNDCYEIFKSYLLREANFSSMEELYYSYKDCIFMQNNSDSSLLGKKLIFPKIRWTRTNKGIVKPMSFFKSRLRAESFREELIYQKNKIRQINYLLDNYYIIKFPMINPPFGNTVTLTFYEDSSLEEEEEWLELLIKRWMEEIGLTEWRVFNLYKNNVWYPFRSGWPVSDTLKVARILGIPYLPRSVYYKEVQDWYIDEPSNTRQYLRYFSNKFANGWSDFLNPDGMKWLLHKMEKIKE